MIIPHHHRGLAALAVVSLVAGGCGPPPEAAAIDTASLAATSPAPATEPIRYDRDIRPILADRCFRCHGPDVAKRQAKLRLDTFEGATAPRKGGAPIVPGHPDQSLILERVASDDADEIMPPPSSNKQPLSVEQRALIERWIADGSVYEPHWSLVPPQKPALPDVRDASWCANEIDRFILARLEQANVGAGPAADPATLVRRVFLDLTGLPPTPSEIDAFQADHRPDAYPQLVDQLLTQEPYRSRHAERMAVPWLDAARYADTCGIHTDAGRQMWSWRDWLLRAYRDNMPFDRFVTEQIAGDLLPNATAEQKVASGFHRNHVTTDEGGAIADEYLVEYAVDRTATTGSVFLGLTLGCARCHEHKYDPISQEDFYRLYAFFNSIDEPGLYSQLPDANRAFEPAMQVPTGEQAQKLATANEQLASARASLDAPAPEEDAQRELFLATLPAQAGLEWAAADVLRAESTAGATLTIKPDHSVLASGANPARDDHVITLHTDATNLNLLMIEALTDPSLPDGRVGRAFNGNAVLSGVELHAVSQRDPSQSVDVPFAWAWASHEQDNGDHRVVNLLDTLDALGWALDGHRQEGGRVAVLLANQPFGFEGGTEIQVRLQHRSVYDQHTLGHVRLSVGRIGNAGQAMLPTAASGWYLVGPFPVESRAVAFDAAFGPERDTVLDLEHNWGSGNQMWRHDPGLLDDRLNNLAAGLNVTYVGRRLFAPTTRSFEVSLGSDDGFRLFVNGEQVAANQIDRSMAANQDRATITLNAGMNTLVLKIVNTGGEGGFYYRALPREHELFADLAAAVIPQSLRPQELSSRLTQAWRVHFSPGYRERREQIASLERTLAEIEAQVPRTMVMQELPQPRETYVLTRGVYDKPDKQRPVTRGIPAALGRLPEGAPLNRLGLAQWLVSADNPLVARVAVNRLWEMFFGIGLVRTSEDFGTQGEWPSHPELLDWLAVTFRESGWDIGKMVRLITTSNTYRQSSRVRTDVRERDPEDRWLAYFPRRRLDAEQVRDQALYVAGLLVEKLGGPSVKPYQPEGLWQEVAMPASNTRVFARGMGDGLWRRSLYTYWKRACPPPALMTFDAPTREFCTIRRTTTSTPLQSLVLWNDQQFVEAARVLAQNVLTSSGADRMRLAELYRRCTGHTPEAADVDAMAATLAQFRTRYGAAKDDALNLIKTGEAPLNADLDPSELAAWTMVANAVLSLDATTSRS